MNIYLPEFLTIAAIHFLAVASPGPDFAILLRQSVSHGRRCALFTSIGIGLGVFVHVFYCIVGLGVVIANSILAFTVIKFLGAIYLIYLGVKALGARPMALQGELASGSAPPSAWGSFVTGLITNVLNPKATLFFLAVFSVTVSAQTPTTVKLFYGIWMAVATTAWFASVGMFFSNSSVRYYFQKCGHWFERIMGGFLIALGLRLAFAKVGE